MFLTRESANPNFKFDVVYSCFQKSLRRNDLYHAYEMAKCFAEYPNALKKRLIYCLVEDAPDFNLIYSIYNTKPELKELIKFVPYCCGMVKCREGTTGFAYAVRMNDCFKPDLSSTKSLLNYIATCLRYGQIEEMLTLFQKQLDDLGFPPKPKLKTIYNFINKTRNVLTGLAVFLTRADEGIFTYTTEADQPFPEIELPEGIEREEFLDLKTFTCTHVPDWVYDKHTAEAIDRSYQFFFDNLILVPRAPVSLTEIIGEKIYRGFDEPAGVYLAKDKELTTSKRFVISWERFTKRLECFQFDPDTSLLQNLKNIKIAILISENRYEQIQTQLITARSKPKTMFIKLESQADYNFILKGPYAERSISRELDAQIVSDKIKRKLGLKHLNAFKLNNYLITENAVKIDSEKTIVKSSKLETDAVLYDGDKHFAKYEDVLTDNGFEFLLILAFRYAIATNDTCPRNILFVKNRFVSIDDPIELSESLPKQMFKKPLPEHDAKTMRDGLELHWDRVRDELNRWLTINISSDFSKRIATLMQKSNWKF